MGRLAVNFAHEPVDTVVVGYGEGDSEVGIVEICGVGRAGRKTYFVETAKTSQWYDEARIRAKS